MTNVRRQGSRPAFTLIELLVVISIIALLIGLLLPALSRARTSARVTQCLGNMKNINVGLETYSSEFGGVIATGVPPEIVGRKMGTRPAHNLVGRIPNNNFTLTYGWMQRYWFTALAPWCTKQDAGNVSVYAEAFLCPDDRTYREEARKLREREDGIGRRVSYLLSDSAFWDPKMLGLDRYTEVLDEDMLAAFSGPKSNQSTPGRVYLQKSRVKFPETKGYLYEPSAFHEPQEYGYNDCDQGANALFFDGHAQKMTMGTNERQRDWEDDLGLPLTCKMPYTQDDFACGDRDDLWWYYGATRNGIRGRDVKSF